LRRSSLRSRTNLRLSGKLVKAFFAAASRTSGIEVAPSAWTRFPAFFLEGREIAHFHSARELDIRLTRSLISQGKPTLRLNPNVEFRPHRSDWISYRLLSMADIQPALGLFHIAVDANQHEIRFRGT